MKYNLDVIKCYVMLCNTHLFPPPPTPATFGDFVGHERVNYCSFAMTLCPDPQELYLKFARPKIPPGNPGGIFKNKALTRRL